MKKNLSPVAGNQSFFIRFFAIFFSYIFHPIFIASYVMIFLLYVHPYVYSGYEQWMKISAITFSYFKHSFFTNFFYISFMAIKLFTQSMKLQTAKERIIPYLLVMIFYFWMWHVFNNQNDPPVMLQFFSWIIFSNMRRMVL